MNRLVAKLIICHFIVTVNNDPCQIRDYFNFNVTEAILIWGTNEIWYFLDLNFSYLIR